MIHRFKTYGSPPYKVALIHGGPGAIGEMAPVAQELSKTMSVLEPFQTRDSVSGQIRELQAILEEHGNFPMVLIGYSWGAFLSLMLENQHPELIKKLILVGCPPFTDHHARSIMQTRINRLNPAEKQRYLKLVDQLQNDITSDKKTIFRELGNLMEKGERFSNEPVSDLSIEFSYDIFEKVWGEAAALREQGHFLDLAAHVSCPVTFIHGDYDPHPIEGIKNVIKGSQFITLEKCGHKPWDEQEASKTFYHVLIEQLA